MKTHFSEMSMKDLQESLANMSGEPLDEIKATYDEERKADIIQHLKNYRKSTRRKIAAPIFGVAALFSIAAGAFETEEPLVFLAPFALGTYAVAASVGSRQYKKSADVKLFGDLISAKSNAAQREITERHKSWVPAEYHEELGLNS